MWCKFGHVPLKIEGNETRVVHRVEKLITFQEAEVPIEVLSGGD